MKPCGIAALRARHCAAQIDAVHAAYDIPHQINEPNDWGELASSAHSARSWWEEPTAQAHVIGSASSPIESCHRSERSLVMRVNRRSWRFTCEY